MGQPRARLLVACLLAVLAGCNGLATQTATQTPAPVPTESPGPTVLAPGVTDAGVVAPARLAHSHDQYLANRSYTLTTNRTTWYANGTLRSHVRTQTRLPQNRSYRV